MLVKVFSGVIQGYARGLIIYLRESALAGALPEEGPAVEAVVPSFPHYEVPYFSSYK